MTLIPTSSYRIPRLRMTSQQLWSCPETKKQLSCWWPEVKKQTNKQRDGCNGNAGFRRQSFGTDLHSSGNDLLSPKTMTVDEICGNLHVGECTLSSSSICVFLSISDLFFSSFSSSSFFSFKSFEKQSKTNQKNIGYYLCDISTRGIILYEENRSRSRYNVEWFFMSTIFRFIETILLFCKS